MHAVGDEHDTAASVAEAGVEMLLTVQSLPSHNSVTFPTGPDPTAIQNRADEHDTADSWPKGISGLGTGCTDQLDAPAPRAPTNATATTNSTPTRTREPRASAIRLNINGPIVRLARIVQ
jgi:hypothetical protein